jgi:hypothetical protein
MPTPSEAVMSTQSPCAPRGGSRSSPADQLVDPIERAAPKAAPASSTNNGSYGTRVKSDAAAGESPKASVTLKEQQRHRARPDSRERRRGRAAPQRTGFR